MDADGTLNVDCSLIEGLLSTQKRFSLMVSQYFLVHIVFIWMLPVRYISNCFFCSGIFANPIHTDVFVNNTIDTMGIEFLFTTQCLISPGFNDNTLIS